MATDLFLEMAELPATGSLGTGQLDTRDLLVAGVPISISSKYLYLYLGLKVLTVNLTLCKLDLTKMIVSPKIELNIRKLISKFQFSEFFLSFPMFS